MLSMASLPNGVVFSLELLDQRPGVIIFRAVGKNAYGIFSTEPGGHRWQRIPPTEKKSRVHTSTFTVVVLPELKAKDMDLDPKDLKWAFARGSGKGGQHKNKTDTCVRLTHLPTKMSVRIDGRSQPANKVIALQVLQARVSLYLKQGAHKATAKDRKDQAGSGQRGDKVRTIRLKDGIVTNHISGNKTSYKKYAAGNFDELF
jgi:peptide chain release factor 1